MYFPTLFSHRSPPVSVVLRHAPKRGHLCSAGKMTLTEKMTLCSAEAKDYRVNIIDTPCRVDFTFEMEKALKVLDGAIFVLSSLGAVHIDSHMRRCEVPRVVFINKLDRIGDDPWNVPNQARSKLRHHSAAVQVPIRREEDLKGLVDLVHLKAYYGETITAQEIPDNLRAMVAEKRQELIQMVSRVDNDLAKACEPVSSNILEEAIRRATIARKFIPVFMGTAFKNKGVKQLLDGVLTYLPCPTDVSNYALDQTNNEEKVKLSGTPVGSLVALAFKIEEEHYGELTFLRIYEGVLKVGDCVLNVNSGKIIQIPRLVRMHSNEMEDIQEAHAGHIVAVIGIDCSSGDTFTDGKVKYTMTSMNVPGPVMSLAVSPFPCTVMDAHIERSVYQFSKALNRFQREDPTFCVAPDHETNQSIIYAMGEQYLNMYVERIEKEYEVGVIVGEPRVNFLETVLSVLNLITHIRSKPEGRTNMYKYVGI